MTLTDYGAVLATLPATVETSAPVIGFLAHVDTSPAFKASDVKPIVHRNYDGSDIVLPDDPSQVLSPKKMPYLGAKMGDDIAVSYTHLDVYKRQAQRRAPARSRS